MKSRGPGDSDGAPEHALPRCQRLVDIRANRLDPAPQRTLDVELPGVGALRNIESTSISFIGRQSALRIQGFQEAWLGSDTAPWPTTCSISAIRDDEGGRANLRNISIGRAGASRSMGSSRSDDASIAAVTEKISPSVSKGPRSGRLARMATSRAMRSRTVSIGAISVARIFALSSSFRNGRAPDEHHRAGFRKGDRTSERIRENTALRRRLRASEREDRHAVALLGLQLPGWWRGSANRRVCLHRLAAARPPLRWPAAGLPISISSAVIARQVFRSAARRSVG